MKVATFFGIAGVVAVLFGLEFLVVPEFALRQYGVPTDPHNLMQARYFGATLLPYGLILWLIRATAEAATVRGILLGTTLGNLVGAILSAWAVLAGLQNAMAWGSVAIYGLLFLAGLYFLMSSTHRG